jgi:hypothetical protein
MVDQILAKTKRKAYLSAVRNESWEMEDERSFGLPIDIHPDVRSVTANSVVPCRVRYLDEQETPTSTTGVFHMTPRVPLSFPIGIAVVFNEEVAQIKVPNNTPAAQVEKMM